jgi:hypothetical protein
MRRPRITIPHLLALACVSATFLGTLLSTTSGAVAGNSPTMRQQAALVKVTRALVRVTARAASKVTVLNPSGVSAPVGNLAGWRQIYLEQFQHAAPTGSFGDCQWKTTLDTSYCPRLPTADRKALVSYSDGIVDTQGTGKYEASQVLSIHNGLLDFYLHSINGTAAGAVVAPKVPSTGDHTGQQYGAYAVRFRASSLPGYHLVFMLWADAYSHGAHWPVDGEMDFPEGNLNTGMNGFFHFDSSSGPSQYAFQHLGSFTYWHTAVIEWTPDQVDYIMDGRVVARITEHIPHVPMHFLIQAETGSPTVPPPTSASGHIQVAWVAAYKPAS